MDIYIYIGGKLSLRFLTMLLAKSGSNPTSWLNWKRLAPCLLSALGYIYLMFSFTKKMAIATVS
jgi:hypothetical protein